MSAPHARRAPRRLTRRASDAKWRLTRRGLLEPAEAIATCWGISVDDMLMSPRPPATFAREALYRYLAERGWPATRIAALLGRDYAVIATARRRQRAQGGGSW